MRKEHEGDVLAFVRFREPKHKYPEIVVIHGIYLRRANGAIAAPTKGEPRKVVQWSRHFIRGP